MALPDVLARIEALQGAFQPRAVAPAPVTGAVAGATTGLGTNAVAASLPQAQGAGAPALGPASAQGGTPAGLAALNLARAEVGVAEQPPGSNDSPRIAQFRQATAGSGVG